MNNLNSRHCTRIPDTSVQVPVQVLHPGCTGQQGWCLAAAFVHPEARTRILSDLGTVSSPEQHEGYSTARECQSAKVDTKYMNTLQSFFNSTYM